MNAGGAAMQRLIDRVRDAHSAKTALDIRGGGTKSFYGNTPRGEVLDVRELSGITSYEPTELVVTVRAGTLLSDLEAELAGRGQCLPFEPPRFAAGGTVGGMVAAGLAGPARLSVGPVRDFVLGLSMLNGRGEVLTFGGQVMKNVAGYDVSRLIAGSMGILGVICEVSLKVTPMPPAVRTLCFDSDESGALRQLNRWAGQAYPLNASCWYRGQMVVRMAGAKSAVAGGPSSLGGDDMTPQAAASWWGAIRDHRHEFFALTQAELAGGHCLWRLSVPDTAPPIALPGDQFIEWGGAQRWLRSAAPAAQVRAAAAAPGGHATLLRAADKSIGAFAAPTPPSMTIQRRLKQSFDPMGIFNPGRLYTEL
jgi:glycolate oxidase FAD binding subunit